MSFNVLKKGEERILADGKPKYKIFKKKDKNLLAGTVKIREISQPNKIMLRINRMFYSLIRMRLERNKIKFPYATAVLPGNNPLKNVMRHLRTGNRYFYAIDIKDFYPSTKIDEVMTCLTDKNLKLDLSTPEELKSFLKKYCFSSSGTLRIGGPASPDLANLVIAHLIDKEMAKLCKKYQLTYTRYLDDLIFSAKRKIGRRKSRAIREIVEQAGFKINPQKTVTTDTKKEPIVITGIGIQNGQIFVKRSFLQKMNGLMHLINKGKAQRKGKKDPVNVVRGLMSAFWSTIPAKGRKLNEIEKRTIRNFLAFSKKHRQRKITRLEKKLSTMIG